MSNFSPPSLPLLHNLNPKSPPLHSPLSLFLLTFSLALFLFPVPVSISAPPSLPLCVSLPLSVGYPSVKRVVTSPCPQGWKMSLGHLSNPYQLLPGLYPLFALPTLSPTLSSSCSLHLSLTSHCLIHGLLEGKEDLLPFCLG